MPRPGAARRRPGPWLPGAAALLLVLAGCASTQRDGPPASPPADLHQVPDAVPRVESIRTGGPNKPYEVFGQRYVPVAADEPMVEVGLASWYGRKFHGLPTASGEIFDMYAMTAAHRTMPLPSYALVRNLANGREVVVRVNDRGPFHEERVIDLSYAAALKLGTSHGLAPVEVQRLTNEEIRSGRWLPATRVAQADAAEVPMPAVALAAPTPTPTPTSTSTSTSTPAPAPAPSLDLAATASGEAGYWLQLGAFRQREGAVDWQRSLMRELQWLQPLLAVFADDALFRVQAGPYATRGEAQRAAERVRGAAALQPLILRR